MSRLYYAKTGQGKLMVGRPTSAGYNAKEYLEKVAKFVPAEIIAGYLAAIGFVPLIKNAGLHEGFYWGIFLLCAILTPIYFKWQADKDQPSGIQIAISSLAFIFWAYSTTGDKIIPQYFDSAIASIVLVVFCLITAFIPVK